MITLSRPGKYLSGLPFGEYYGNTRRAVAIGSLNFDVPYFYMPPVKIPLLGFFSDELC